MISIKDYTSLLITNLQPLAPRKACNLEFKVYVEFGATRVLRVKVRLDASRLQPDQTALQCHGDRRRAVGDTQLAKDVDEV